MRNIGEILKRDSANLEVFFMKLLVMSDIHDNLANMFKVIDFANNIRPDLIVFCGDLVSPFTAVRMSNALSRDIQLIGVWGNNEGDRDTILRRISENMSFGTSIIIRQLGRRKLLIFHGLESTKDTEMIITSLAKSGDYDIILFGHIHHAEIIMVSRQDRSVVTIDVLKEIKTKNTPIPYEINLNERIVAINPGEVCGWLTNVPTFTLLELDENNLKVTYYRIDEM